jgi:hypothetical protein
MFQRRSAVSMTVSAPAEKDAQIGSYFAALAAIRPWLTSRRRGCCDRLSRARIDREKRNR